MNRSRPLSLRNARRLRIRKDESGVHTGAPAGFVPAGGTPTPTPAPGGNNNPGNVGQPGGESQTDNNGGQPFDAEAFWNPPSGGEGAGPDGSQGSAPAPTPPGANIGQTLSTALTNMRFSDGDFMTPTLAEEMSQGNFTNFNQNLQQYGQNVARQTIQQVVPILKAVRDQIMADVGQTVQGEFGSREDSAALVKAIPSAANPKVAPIVKPIFEQAMRVAKGDRAKAIEMTKTMLQMTNSTLVDDSSLGIAPRGAGDSTTPKVNWLEELTGR